MHVDQPSTEPYTEDFPEDENPSPGIPWTRRLGGRLAAGVVLPVAVVLLLLLLVQRASLRGDASSGVEDSLTGTLEMMDELLASRTERFRGMLLTLLTQEATAQLVELWEAGELERAALTSGRIERACEQLIKLEPTILGIELHSQKGKLLLSVAAGGVPPGSFDVQSEEWFGGAERQGEAVSCSDGRVRIARRYSAPDLPGGADAPLYGSFVLDLTEMARPAIAFAQATLDGARLTLETDAGQLFLTDTLPMTETDLVSAAAPTSFCRGSLRIERGRHPLRTGAASGGGLAPWILACILLGTLWVALQQTVLIPLASTDEVAQAFRTGTELPPAPDRPGTALALQPVFALREHGKRWIARLRKTELVEPMPQPEQHEIAQVDRALRDAVAVARESENARRSLSQTFDRRVAEYSGSLLHDKQEAEAASQSKSQFIASLANGLRMPVSAALRGTESLLAQELSDEQRELAQAAHGSVDDVQRALDEVRDYTALEAGRIQLQAIEFDLHTAIEDMSELLARAARSRGIELVPEILPGVPRTVVGDPMRFCQVLRTLAEHILASTRQGDVLVRVSPSQVAATQLMVEVRGTGARPAFGAGTDAGAVDPFAPSQPGSSSATGLGLAICRQLVQEMHGEISWRSAQGEGTTFWFTATLTGTSRAAAVTGLAGRRVLVVDDNPMSRRVLASRLSQWGIDASQASGTREAITLVQERASQGHPFEAAVVDLEMPDMDGLDLARWIKDDVDCMEMPLVLLTEGQRDLEGESSLFAAQIEKPARGDALAESLQKALPERAAAPAPVQASPAPSSTPTPLSTSTPTSPTPPPTGSIPLTAGASGSSPAIEPAAPISQAASKAAASSRVGTPPSAAPPREAPEEPPAPLPAVSDATGAPGGAAASTDPSSLAAWAPDEPARVLLAATPGPATDGLVNLLLQIGYGVEVVNAGEDVLELVDSEPFHALLIERDLAGMDGPQVTRRLRSRSDLKASMPILALTPGPVLDDRDACVQAGMDDCIETPAVGDKLGSTLKRWVSVSSHLSRSEQSRIAALHGQRLADGA